MAQFTIRVPDEMRERIKRAAEGDRRSMNAEIEWLLDDALARREECSGSGAKVQVRRGDVA